MKKIVSFIMVMFLTLSLTGCVKYNVNMDIVEKYTVSDNRYEEYLLRSRIASTLKNIKYNINKKSVESLDATIKEEIG